MFETNRAADVLPRNWMLTVELRTLSDFTEHVSILAGAECTPFVRWYGLSVAEYTSIHIALFATFALLQFQDSPV